jgi:hypothetical protein
MRLAERSSGRDVPTFQDLGSMGGWSEFENPQATEAEVERQARIYQQLNFHNHEKLGMSLGQLKDVIMRAVPSLQQIPHWRFDIPLVGFGQIPVVDQMQLVGAIYNDIPSKDRELVADWKQDLQGYQTPEGIYLTWILDGGIFMGRTVEEIRAILLSRSQERRGATLHDGIALAAVHPEIFCSALSRSVHGVDLPGTEAGPDKAPSIQLDSYGEDLSIETRRIDGADPQKGSATCVRKMILAA